MNHHDRRLIRRQLLSAAADGAHVLTHMYPQWRSGSGTENVLSSELVLHGQGHF